MNPEILWQVAAEHHRDSQVRAHEARSARSLVKALRAVRHGGTEAGEFAMPAIPDYVDGSFRVDAKVGDGTGPVPAARRAA
jgi:hypothetical protein